MQNDLTRSSVLRRPWDRDRYMAPDIDNVTKLLKEEKIWQSVRGYIEEYNSSQVRETYYPFKIHHLNRKTLV